MNTEVGVYKKTPGSPPLIEVLVKVEYGLEELYLCDGCGDYDTDSEEGRVYQCPTCKTYYIFRLDDLPDPHEFCSRCDGEPILGRIDGTGDFEYEKYCYACDDGPITAVERYVCLHPSCNDASPYFAGEREVLTHIDDQHLDVSNWTMP